MMHSSSLFNLFTAGLACFATSASAWTQPKGNAPEGNPIFTPGSSSIVPVGKPYDITWTPTTKGTVTLLLLKGPGSNAVPQYPIIEHLPNSGKFTWTPPTTLAPGTTGYGIELIDDATGQYQFTTQFGISNPDYEKDSDPSNAASSSSSSDSATTSSSAAAAATTSAATTSSSSADTKKPADKTTASTGTAASATGTGGPSASSGAAHVTSALQPSKSMTVPASLITTTSTAAVVTSPANASSSLAPPAGNGAGKHVAGASLGALALVAGMAVLVL